MPATAGVVDLARGEDARVAGVYDMRGEWTSACGRCEKFGEGEWTPALRALLIWRGGTDGRHGGRFWLWHRRHRRRRRGQSRQHQSGRAPQIYRQTKNKTRHGSPKQGAFCKESNIREVVQKRANALRNCYEQQLLANPDLSGKIIVFWKIGLDGKVTDASIKSTTMNNARVESCLTQTVRRLRFDKPDGGICVVEFPFIFTSAQ